MEFGKWKTHTSQCKHSETFPLQPNSLDICKVLATSLGTFHEWLPRRKHCSDLEPNELKKKHALGRAETSTKSKFYNKQSSKIEKQKIEKFMKTSGNSSVFCKTQGNCDAKQWSMKNVAKPRNFEHVLHVQMQKKWFYGPGFPPAGMI